MGDDQKALKKRLKVLMNRPENQVCSDCPERQPRWASLIVPPPGAPEGSLPIGAFCCLECSGSHRRLGVHIAFVRSVNLDSWKEREVLAMENGGNAKVNAIFEALAGQTAFNKPGNHADGPTRERFIRDKYERRKFYDPAAFRTLPSATALADISQPPPSASAMPGPPSDAARQRMEARRLKPSSSSGPDSTPARNLTPPRAAPARTKSGNKPRPPVPKAPVSAPPPTNTADLLDLNFDPLPAATNKPTPPPPQTAVATAPAPATATPSMTGGGGGQLDLFQFLVADRPQVATANQPATTAAAKASAQDILNLYQNNNQNAMMMAHPPSMNHFATQFATYGNANNNYNATQASNQLTNMMGQLTFHPAQQATPQMIMMYQQQQQQQQFLMMQQQQQFMIMQQQQQGLMSTAAPLMNPPSAFSPQMASQGSVGFSSGTNAMPNHTASTNPPKTQGTMTSFQSQDHRRNSTTDKEDPFAQFGVNVFRS